MNRRKSSRRVFGSILSLALGVALAGATGPAIAAGPTTKSERGPLTGAAAVKIEIVEKGAGGLGFLLPLPNRRHGHHYEWSEAEVNTVRAGGKGFCRVEVRRGADDPAHDLEIRLNCGQRRGKAHSTDLRLETTHTFGKRKKATVAEFSHPDGSRTSVVVSAL